MLISATSTLKLGKDDDGEDNEDTDTHADNHAATHADKFKFSRNVTVEDITEKIFRDKFPGVELVIGRVEGIREDQRIVTVRRGGRCEEIKYWKLCLAVGSSPTLGPFPPSLVSSSPKFLNVIRDANSVRDLRLLLKNPRVRSVAVVGNGGIAMEVVHALTQGGGGTRVEWIVRDKFVGHALLDATAAAFLLPSLGDRMVVEGEGDGEGGSEVGKEGKVHEEIDKVHEEEGSASSTPPPQSTPAAKRLKRTAALPNSPPYGSAVGPNWFDKFRAGEEAADPNNSSKPEDLFTFTNAKCACHSCGPGAFCIPMR